MLKVLNDNNVEVNVLHFQGKSREILKTYFNLIKDRVVLDNIEDSLSIVSCWTDYDKCYLYKQLKKFNINLINSLPDNYDISQPWDMRNKIRFYIDCLTNKVNTEYVMLLDGYDVLFTSTKDILTKFKSTGYRIIFNTTYNNYPPENIDYIEDRKNRVGFFQYFNAGCCIGYRQDLIKFYTQCLDYIDIPNPANSEQKILRHCFSNYSNDLNQKFVWLDTGRSIFHTMAYTKPIYNEPDNTIQIINKDPDIKDNIKDFPVTIEDLRFIYEFYGIKSDYINFSAECDNPEINSVLKNHLISISGKTNWIQIKVPRFVNNIDLFNYFRDIRKTNINLKISLLDDKNEEFFYWQFNNSVFLNTLSCCLDSLNKEYVMEKEYTYLSFSYYTQIHP